MPLKKVLLYDVANSPLQVNGIRVELHDASAHKMLKHGISADLNPLPGGLPSKEWGVLLNFPSGTRPVDILILDPNYQYPGNSLRYLNGDLSDEVYMDLLQLPSGPGGGGPPQASTPPSLNVWIDEQHKWSPKEKEAVRNLIFNYALIVGPSMVAGRVPQHLHEIAQNWTTAAQKVGVPEAALNVVAQRQVTRSYSASS